MNHHPHVTFLICIPHLRLGCELLEDEMNLVQNTLIQNHVFIFELEYETTTASLGRLKHISLRSREEIFPPTHLDPYGFKTVIGVGSSLGDLQGLTFQHPMKCKGINLSWEDGSLHWRSTKMKHGRRHLHVVE